VGVEIKVQEVDNLQVVAEWSARARAVSRQFTYYAAQAVYDELQNRIPKEAKKLRKSLQLSRVQGLKDAETGFVIRSIPRGVQVAAADVPSTLIYVSAKKGFRRIPKAVKILEEHSPWTVDLMPIQPDPKTANIVSRKVNPKAVEKVKRMRTRDRAVWRRKLNEAGLRETRKDTQLKVNRQMRAIPDVAFDSIRLEFGIGGIGSKPHWRPAILKLASGGGAGMIAKKQEFVRAMTSPSFQAWRNWPTKVSGRVSAMDLVRYVPFEKKLGLRIKRA
jgi:hypothetical protein